MFKGKPGEDPSATMKRMQEQGFGGGAEWDPLEQERFEHLVSGGGTAAYDMKKVDKKIRRVLFKGVEVKWLTASSLAYYLKTIRSLVLVETEDEKKRLTKNLLTFIIEKRTIFKNMGLKSKTETF